MKYILGQKLVSLGDDFTILDEDKNKAFFIDGKILTLTEKLYFLDNNKKRILKIKKKLIRLTDFYEITKNGKTYATIRKQFFTLFRDKFHITTPYGDITVKGNIIDYDFSFYLNKEEIAVVSKKFLSIRDKYVIDINNFEDHALLLACAVTIDMMCHNHNEED